MERHTWIKVFLVKYYKLLAGILLLLLHITSSAAGVGIRYEYHKDDYVANWTAAQQICADNAGQLAGDIDIDDWELMYGKSSVFLDDTSYWIGLHRQPNKKWKWLNGDDLDLNATTSFPLRPEYEANITYDCVHWDVQQPFFIPQACDKPSPFICKLNAAFSCDYNHQRNKALNETNITTYNDMTELQQAKDAGKLASPAYLVYNNVTADFCKQYCDNFDIGTARQCWMFEYHVMTPAFLCRLVISDWKPVLVNLQSRPDAILSAKYCVEVEKFTNCPMGEECLCGNVTAPPSVKELLEIVEETKKKLTVVKTNLSATVRRKTSAPDPRPTSMTMGYFGVSMLTITFGGLVLLDCSSLVGDFKMMFYNLRCKEPL